MREKFMKNYSQQKIHILSLVQQSNHESRLRDSCQKKLGIYYIVSKVFRTSRLCLTGVSRYY